MMVLLHPFNAWQKILPSNKKSGIHNLSHFLTFSTSKRPPFWPTSSHAGGFLATPCKLPTDAMWAKLPTNLFFGLFVCLFLLVCWFVLFPAFLGSFRFLLVFVYLPVASFLPFFLLFWQIDQKAKNKNKALENYRSTKPEAKLCVGFDEANVDFCSSIIPPQ